MCPRPFLLLLAGVALVMLAAGEAEAEASPMEESYQGNPVVTINLTYDPGPGGDDAFEGEIVLELFFNWAPVTVTNFVDLVNQSFYDGIFFHRIIDDFVIQSGDPTCRTTVVYTPVPTCGEGGSGETIPFESNANLTHVNGAIGMARGADPDSAESQWYICDEPQHQLDNGNRTLPDDPGYAVFGIVREGLELVRAAAAVPTTNDPGGEDTPRVGTGVGDRPLYEVHINSITLSGWIQEIKAPAPTAIIHSIFPSPAGKDENVTFRGHGMDEDGNITGYFWTSSVDGNLSTEANFTISALSLGHHNITFQVQDNDGAWSSAVSESLWVYTVPVATAGEDLSIEVNQPVQFSGTGTDEDGTILKYEWDFDGDGVYDLSSSDNGHTTNVYNNEGTYTAVLRVTDNDGFTATDSRVITVSKAGEGGGGDDCGDGIPTTSLAAVAVVVAAVAVIALRRPTKP